MNYIRKVIPMLFINIFIINMLYFFSFNVFAISTKINPDGYSPEDSTIDASEAKDTYEKAGKIIGAVRIVASVASVLAIVVLGIKFMLGSAEEKADYQKWMIYYFIGAVLVFAISNIIVAIYNAVNPVNS